MADHDELEGDVKQRQTQQGAGLGLPDEGQQQAGQGVAGQPKSQRARLAQAVGQQRHQSLAAQFRQADDRRSARQRGDLQAKRILQPDAEDEVDQFVGSAGPQRYRDACQRRNVPQHSPKMGPRTACEGVVRVAARRHPPQDRKHAHSQERQQRERRRPAIARNQEAHGRHAGNEGQRPTHLGHGQRQSTPLIGNAVAEVGLHGRVEQVLAQHRQNERRRQRPQRGRKRNQPHPKGEQGHPRQHPKAPSALVGHG